MTEFFITTCIVFAAFAVVFVTLYAMSSTKKNTGKTRNEVDEEIENELKQHI
ncbi:hypothetical protein KORDIASMS9_01302 [Kordia sp. SMS9]|uniref:hypothetical protein n=1 Tax=Kordia sp. SMS9 TaxID=2282170 RepID=UPI000E100150|nr:hypothetical protein [Kordia sp. SMS9]AXG69083.1 hypothetical protein KORDIASMS9_01302 [Kordia sp. SMS9]